MALHPGDAGKIDKHRSLHSPTRRACAAIDSVGDVAGVFSAANGKRLARMYVLCVLCNARGPAEEKEPP